MLPDRELPLGQLGCAQFRLREDVNSCREPTMDPVGEGQPMETDGDEADDEADEGMDEEW